MDLPVFVEIILFILVIIIAALLVAFLSKKILSGGGGGASNIVAGATADLLNAEKRRAIDNILDQQTVKEMDEQESGQNK
ncbi:hypothetical protein ACFLTH_11430 [Bacteroidota bacterium]